MDNPFAGLKNVNEVNEVVKVYVVRFENMTIRVEVHKTFGMKPGMEYMAIPDHALDLGAAPFAPLRNYASPEEAVRELLFEFSIRYDPNKGENQWVPFPIV